MEPCTRPSTLASRCTSGPSSRATSSTTLTRTSTSAGRRAAAEGAELLVVVGGDGSVHEVVNGIAERDGIEIAVIPRGTGWDFARSLGLPRKIDRAIEVALSGKTRTIDLGRANYRLWAGG